MDYSMPRDPRELDEAIIAWIREFDGMTWYDLCRNIRGCGADFMKKRLTKLRKAGLITYSRKTQKWMIAPCV